MTDEVRTHYGDDTPLDARWYVVHTYSGYENKVKEDLEKTIENRNLQDLILEVKYPTEQVTELKEGSKKPKTVLRKVERGFIVYVVKGKPRRFYCFPDVEFFTQNAGKFIPVLLCPVNFRGQVVRFLDAA